MSWPIVEIGAVAEIVSGSTPSTATPNYWGGDLPWATPADLAKLNSKLISATPRTLTAQGLAASSARLLPVESVLFSSRAPIGHVAINTVPMATNQGFKSFVPDAAVLSADFLYWWLKSNTVFLQSLGVGATFKEISKSIVERVKIPLPPLPEQRRIASILDEASELVRKRRQQLNVTDSLIDATYSEMFGDLDANDRSWPMGVVHDLVSGFSSGKSIIGDEESGSATYRVLKISSVTTGRFDPTESKPLPPDYTPPERHLVSRGDLLISRANTSALVGATALVQDDVQGIALPDKIWRFDWTPGVGDPSLFVWQTFSRPEFRRRISEIATGTGGSMKNISQGAVLSLPIPIPPIERREAFANEFSKLDRLRRLHLRDLAKLDELFASLQYRAFRGEL